MALLINLFYFLLFAKCVKLTTIPKQQAPDKKFEGGNQKTKELMKKESIKCSNRCMKNSVLSSWSTSLIRRLLNSSNALAWFVLTAQNEGFKVKNLKLVFPDLRITKFLNQDMRGQRSAQSQGFQIRIMYLFYDGLFLQLEPLILYLFIFLRLLVSLTAKQD